jgi:hypothetical protein
MSFSSNPKKELVLFYADYCSHCSNLMAPGKVWPQLEDLYANDPLISIKKISYREVESMGWLQKQRYIVSGQTEFRLDAYPTILLVDEFGARPYQTLEELRSGISGSRSFKSLQLFLTAPDYYEKLMALKAKVMSGGAEYSIWSQDMKILSRSIYSQFDL